MLKDLLVHVRYPYATGIIAVIWLGTAILAAIEPSAIDASVFVLNAIATVFIALVGFSSPR